MARRLVGSLAASAVAASLVTTGASAQTGGTGAPGSTPPPPAPNGSPAEGEAPAPSVRLLDARARPGNSYYLGVKPSRFAITLAAKRPTDVRIDILAKGSGLLRSLYQPDVQPRTNQAIPWDGLTTTGTVPRGKLRFRVSGVNGEEIKQSKKFTGKMKFGMYDHIFPIRGKHSYGDGLGAGRGHQGQDLPADCGTKLVAARGGTVQTSGFQKGGSGYYVVIDGLDSDFDYVYMHMLSLPIVKAGDEVRTGQPIGQVGSTGRSTGCHLHFEMWSAPGWYTGGSTVNPTAQLRAWDAYS